MDRRAVALLAFASVLALALGEGATRWVGSRPRPYLEVTGTPIHEPDSVVGWRPRRQHRFSMRSPEYRVEITTNEEGFRWTHWDGTAACRVLVIGDSFVAGYAVGTDSLFWVVAARASGCSVAGVGVIGYGTDQELVLLREYLPKLRPTHVVLAFYQNDVWCNHQVECEQQRKLRYALRGSSLLRTSAAAPRTAQPSLAALDSSAVPSDTALRENRSEERVGLGLRSRQWLAKHSALYRLVWNAIRRPELPIGEGVMSALRPGGGLREEFRVLHRPYDPDIADAWAVSEAIIAEMQRETRAAGARFWLMQMPLRAQIWDDEWREAQRALKMGPGWQVDAVTQELGAICQRRGIERCLFPIDALKRATSPAYFRGDAHFTAAGHSVVGRELGGALGEPTASR